MGNPNCCFMIIAETFFSSANRLGELWAPPINRFAAIANTQQDKVTGIARQPPMDLPSLWGSNNTQSNNATFATEFRALFGQNHTNFAP